MGVLVAPSDYAAKKLLLQLVDKMSTRMMARTGCSGDGGVEPHGLPLFFADPLDITISSAAFSYALCRNLVLYRA